MYSIWGEGHSRFFIDITILWDEGHRKRIPVNADRVLGQQYPLGSKGYKGTTAYLRFKGVQAQEGKGEGNKGVWYP